MCTKEQSAGELRKEEAFKMWTWRIKLSALHIEGTAQGDVEESR